MISPNTFFFSAGNQAVSMKIIYLTTNSEIFWHLWNLWVAKKHWNFAESISISWLATMLVWTLKIPNFQSLGDVPNPIQKTCSQNKFKCFSEELFFKHVYILVGPPIGRRTCRWARSGSALCTWFSALSLHWNDDLDGIRQSAIQQFCICMLLCYINMYYILLCYYINMLYYVLYYARTILYNVSMWVYRKNDVATFRGDHFLARSKNGYRSSPTLNQS